MDTLLTSVGISLASALALAFGAVKWLSTRFIERAIARGLEGLKSELTLYVNAQAVVHARVDTQRANAATAVYEAFRSWKQPALRLLDVENDPPETYPPDYETEFTPGETDILHTVKMAREILTAGDQLRRVLDENAIYFDTSMHARLSAAERDVRASIAEFLGSFESAMEYTDMDTYISSGKREVADVRRVVTTEIKPLSDEVVATCRRLLGSDVVIARPQT